VSPNFGFRTLTKKVNPMLSLIKSACLVFVTASLVGISGNVQADDSEPLAAADAQEDVGEDLRPSGPVRCVNLTDGVLDLRILANASDVWSTDANVSIGGSEGEATLYVVSSGTTLTVSVLFLELSDQATITDALGVVRKLKPITTANPVVTTISVAPDKPIDLAVLGSGGGASTAMAMIPPKDPPVGASNRAVIKPVITCPT
jgi:hypothetical protein